MTTFLNDDLAPPDADEQAEAMARDALVYELSVVLMRLDGNEGDPHQLIWCGGPTPEPWGDAWLKYEEPAEAVINAIGEGSALALVEALKEDAWVARVVSSGPLANLPCLEWRSADVSLRTPIGAKLYARPAPAAEAGVRPSHAMRVCSVRDVACVEVPSVQQCTDCPERRTRGVNPSDGAQP